MESKKMKDWGERGEVGKGWVEKQRDRWIKSGVFKAVGYRLNHLSPTPLAILGPRLHLLLTAAGKWGECPVGLGSINPSFSSYLYVPLLCLTDLRL